MCFLQLRDETSRPDFVFVFQVLMATFLASNFSVHCHIQILYYFSKRTTTVRGFYFTV